MNIRILRPEEWGRVNSPGLPELLLHTAPQNIALIVAEDEDGEVIGSIAALRVTHLEGLWVKPEHRGGMVAYRLYQQALALARAWKEEWVLGGAANGDERMDDLIQRCGGKALAMRVYSMPVGGN